MRLISPCRKDTAHEPSLSQYSYGNGIVAEELHAIDVLRKSLDTALNDACVTLQSHQILLPSAVQPPCLVAYATIVHHFG